MHYDPNQKYESFGDTFGRILGKVLAYLTLAFFIWGTFKLAELAFDMHAFVGVIFTLFALWFWLRMIANAAHKTWG